MPKSDFFVTRYLHKQCDKIYVHFAKKLDHIRIHVVLYTYTKKILHDVKTKKNN